MKKRIAINGYGRIGRATFRILMDRSDVDVVAINDLSDNKMMAHLLQHDSIYGEYERTVGYDDESISVDGRQIKTLAIKDPANLPWQELGVDVVIECTGMFNDPSTAQAHNTAGAKKVVLSAPAKGKGATTIIIGVNDDEISSAGDIISCASCTTNCIAPVMAVLSDNFSVKKAIMNTVHSYTSDQNLLDNSHRDPRRARAAAISIVPTSTGASTAATEVLPELAGKFGGTSYRVPTPTVSICDIVIVLDQSTTADAVNKTLRAAAKEPYYQGILATTDDELVSSDFIGNAHSAIVDLPLTQVVDGDLLKVVAWYDNEWGYSNRLAELAADVAKGLEK